MYHLLKLFVFAFYFQAKMPSLELTLLSVHSTHTHTSVNSVFLLACQMSELKTTQCKQTERYIDQHEELRLWDLTDS